MRRSQAKLCRQAAAAAALTVLISSMVPHAARAQFNSGMGQAPTSPQPLPRQPGIDDPDPFPPELREKARKLRNEQRHKQIVSDTHRLLTLAAELQADLGAPAKRADAARDTRKAEEIEKLARNVSNKMKSE